MLILLWDKWCASVEAKLNNFNVLSRLGSRDENSHTRDIYSHYENPPGGILFVSPFHVKRTWSLQWKDYLQSEQLANHPLNLCLEMFNAKRKSHIVFSRKNLKPLTSIFPIQWWALETLVYFSFFMCWWVTQIFESVQFTIVQRSFHNLQSLLVLKTRKV